MQFISAIIMVLFPFAKRMLICLWALFFLFQMGNAHSNPGTKLISKKISQSRERISINDNWRFMRYTSEPDKLIYDIRPEVNDRNDNIVADTKPTEAVFIGSFDSVLKKWIGFIIFFLAGNSR